jgi:hypothetical protein
MLKVAGNYYGHLEPINRKIKFVSAVKKPITHVHLILSGGEASILVTDAGKIKRTEIVDETHMDNTHTHIKQLSKLSRSVFWSTIPYRRLRQINRNVFKLHHYFRQSFF